MCDIVEAQMEAMENGENGGLLTFKSILAHEGPLSIRNPQYKGSAWNILVEWAEGEPTWESLNLIAKCDPVSVALYGEASTQQEWVEVLEATCEECAESVQACAWIMKARMNGGPKYKYGTRLPDKQKTCAELDKENRISKWQEANQAELTFSMSIRHLKTWESLPLTRRMTGSKKGTSSSS